MEFELLSASFDSFAQIAGLGMISPRTKPEIVMFLLVGTREQRSLDLEIYVSVAGGASRPRATLY